MRPAPASPISVLVAFAAALALAGSALAVPKPEPASAADQPTLHAIADSVSAKQLQATIAKLVGFGTRHTLSDTQSNKRGIGAARRWAKSRFEAISKDCKGCLQVVTPSQVVTGKRIPTPAEVMDVVAIQRGSSDPQRVILITGHLDSRVTDPMDFTSDAPGANDDASGVAAVIEAARVLSKHRFAATIVYGVLSGEEQGLHGGKVLADYARAQGWQVEADLNNDIVGNTDGGINNTSVRVFSEGTKAVETVEQADRRRYNGGEVDSPSRNIARYMKDLSARYLKDLRVDMVYRTDRYGRGGDQVEFLKAGYPAVRVTEARENYTRQHQDLRIENDVTYGDRIEGVDFAYLAQVTRLNAVTLAALASAPMPPAGVSIEGAVSADTAVKWNVAPGAVAYRVWWRETTAPQWQHNLIVPGGTSTQTVLKNVVIDDWFFGVSSISADGYESPVVFPGDAGSFTSTAAPAPVAANLPSFEPKRLSDITRELSSDAYEGRGPATPGEIKTIDYVTKQMQAAGLQPGGDLKDGKRLWTQAVPLLRARIDGPLQLTLKSEGKPQSLTQGQEIAIRAALNGSRAVAITDAPLVFVGYAVKAPERNWDDFKGVDLRGKIAIALINDPDFETGVGDFGGKAMTYYGRWTYKFEEVARQGALGLLIVHETAGASYGWPTVKNSNTNTMFDIVRDQPALAHSPMEGWIQRDLAVDLFNRSGLDFEALKLQARTRDFKPVQLKRASLSAAYAVDAQIITSQNIAGRIEGSKRPDETVVYSAHWDHLGVGEPDAKGDRIYNGAVDNATGTAALIEMARVFAQQPRPERSVLFLNVTAEEKGLLGSEYYASKPLYPLAKTVGVINVDALSPGGPARDFNISGSAKLELLDELVADAKGMGLVYSPDPKPEAGHFFRSDHFPFAKRGVPAISFGSGVDLIDGGVAAGKAAQEDYTTNRYHQPADEWQADWSFTGMARDLQLLYKLGADLANSNRWPNWSQDSEFRGKRDESVGERR